MQSVISTLNPKNSPGTPSYEYLSFLPIWKRSRAILGGQKSAKEHDAELDLKNFTNILVPFSPSMRQSQYTWYVAEAELPGMAAQYARVILGGLLRKPPTLTLPDGTNDEVYDWLVNRFTEDGRPMLAFLDDAVFEELTTSRCWVSIDFPKVDPNALANMDYEQRIKIAPYPVIWKAEDVINWQVTTDLATGRPTLGRVIFRYIDPVYLDNPWHPEYLPTLADHYLDENGNYAVQFYRQFNRGASEVRHGEVTIASTGFMNDVIGETEWELVGEPNYPLMNGEYMKYLPVFPLNGEIRLEPPILTSVIDKEISIYNLMSRRNHLLYGASTYTPVLKSNMMPEEFEALVSGGLGAWIQIGTEDTIDILRTPTEAVADLATAIDAGRKDLADLGTRMLAPDSAQSGIALQIRNAPQTAQLGSMNNKISTTMRQIIRCMIEWKYGVALSASDIQFTLSEDFDSGAHNPETARLVTEWYQSGLIPRSLWISIQQGLELIPTDYDDQDGMAEIGRDPILAMSMGYNNGFDLTPEEDKVPAVTTPEEPPTEEEVKK